MAEIVVITDALRDEARKWRQLADDMAVISGAAQRLELALTAFFIGDANAAVHCQAYDDFQSFMAGVLGGAVVEFEQLGGALDKIADAYDTSDAVVSLDLNKIYRR